MMKFRHVLIYLFILVNGMVIGALFAPWGYGSFAADKTYDAADAKNIEDGGSLAWHNSAAEVVTKTRIERKETVYEVTVKLKQIGEEVRLFVSPLEYGMIREGDNVEVLYIYDRSDQNIEYCQWARDDKGRIQFNDMRPVVVLDAGHGGLDDGEGSNELWIEKDMTLKMTKLMEEHLEEAGLRVIMTRTYDEYITLYDRCAIANYLEADLFISNHLNRMDEDTSGVEVLYGSDGDREFAKVLANAVATEEMDVFRVYNRKHERLRGMDYYFIHKYGDRPGYIIEYGFADNEYDAQYIAEHWEEMVEDASLAIVDYLIE